MRLSMMPVELALTKGFLQQNRFYHPLLNPVIPAEKRAAGISSFQRRHQWFVQDILDRPESGGRTGRHRWGPLAPAPQSRDPDRQALVRSDEMRPVASNKNLTLTCHYPEWNMGFLRSFGHPFVRSASV